MISVIVAVYNGEKYIIDQLESIRNQDLQVDEVLITDDCSTDETYQLCNSYINKNKLNDKWKIKRNSHNKGYFKNFMDGISETSGDIIFLADQDDIWKKEKTKVMCSYLLNNKILSLTSTFDIMAANGKILNYHQKHPYHVKNGIRKIKISEFLRFPNYLGMTMAIKRELFDNINYENINLISHDIFINLNACYLNGLYYLDIPLTIRRVYKSTSYLETKTEITQKYHGNAQIFKLSRKKRYCEKYLITVEIDKRTQNILKRYRKSYSNRISYLTNHSLVGFFKNIKYLTCYENYRNFFYELLVVMKGD